MVKPSKPWFYYGEQLTVERARASQKARIASDTKEATLAGLEPAVSDWHAEANFFTGTCNVIHVVIGKHFDIMLLQYCTSHRQLYTIVQIWIKLSGWYTTAVMQFNQPLQCEWRHIGQISCNNCQLVVECHILAAAIPQCKLWMTPCGNALPALDGKTNAEKMVTVQEVNNKAYY